MVLISLMLCHVTIFILHVVFENSEVVLFLLNVRYDGYEH